MGKKIAVITGASSGIGAAYARILARENDLALVLAARRLERLESLKAEISSTPVGADVRCLEVDLRKQDDIQRLASQVNALGGTIEYLINNAGFGSVGPYESSNFGWESDMVAVNCIAPIALSRLLLQNMERGSTIINVCSIVSFIAVPQMSTYCATKAFLLSHSVSLRQELRHRGINVLAVCPGATLTEFHLVSGLSEKVAVGGSMSAESVVEKSLRAAARRSGVVVTGLTNKLGTAAASHLPKALTSRLAGWVMSRHLTK
jgi:uncharacterized protein